MRVASPLLVSSDVTLINPNGRSRAERRAVLLIITPVPLILLRHCVCNPRCDQCNARYADASASRFTIVPLGVHRFKSSSPPTVPPHLWSCIHISSVRNDIHGAHAPYVARMRPRTIGICMQFLFLFSTLSSHIIRSPFRLRTINSCSADRRWAPRCRAAHWAAVRSAMKVTVRPHRNT